MALRKWLIRGLVFGVLGAAATAGVVYQRWTDPTVVRQQVMAKLQTAFPELTVSLDSAHMRLLGGIALTELRLSPRDDPENNELLNVPSATLYHDKENLLGGTLGLRRVELHRPRLHVLRGQDGRWNLAALAGGPGEQGPLPTLVVQNGTILFEDRQAGGSAKPLEIVQVNLTAVNDPPNIVRLEGTGVSEATGKVRIRGSCQRDNGAAQFSLEALDIPVGPALVQRVAAYCPEKTLDGLSLTGKASLKADLGYQPGSTLPLSYDVSVQLRHGLLEHPQIPLPLKGLELSARCVNGYLTVEKLTASSGEARLTVTGGEAQLPQVADNFKGLLTVRHLHLCPKLCDRLPEAIRTLHTAFRPSGPATLQVNCVRKEGVWKTLFASLAPESISVCYDLFRYPIEGVTGTVAYDFLTQLLTTDLKGRAGPATVTLGGHWKGLGDEADVKLDVHATNVPLDDKLLAALPADLQDVYRSFHARGWGNGQAFIRQQPGTKGFVCTYHAQFCDTAVKWDDFAYPVEQITGALDIYPDRWEIRDCRGRHGKGTLWIQGRSLPLQPGEPPGTPARVVLDVIGRDVPLDADLRHALDKMPGMAKTWETFVPQGQVHFTSRIECRAKQIQDLDISLDFRQCSVEPLFFPYQLQELCGQLRYHKNRVQLSRFTAKHEHARFSLEKGTIDLYPGGAYYAVLEDLRGNPVHPNADFLRALPKPLQNACKTLAFEDPFALQTRLVVSQSADPASLPDVFWDGQLWLQNAKLNLGVEVSEITGTLACIGRHNGWQMLGLNGNVLLDRAMVFKQPFRNVHSKLQMREDAPEVLLIGLQAPIFDGDVSGQARLDFNPSTLRYELNLTASQIQLEQFGRHNFGAQPQLSGVASARLHLTGRGDGVSSLDGNGSLRVPYSRFTRLYNLPLLLDLLKFLGLRWPDRTAFEEAIADFSIHGNRVNIARLDLLGNVVSLYGKGDVNLDGTNLHLDFYPSWGRVEQMLPQMVRGLSPAISKNLLQIEMRGNVGATPSDLTFIKKPVPILMDPLMQLRDRVVGKKN